MTDKGFKPLKCLDVFAGCGGKDSPSAARVLEKRKQLLPLSVVNQASQKAFTSLVWQRLCGPLKRTRQLPRHSD